MKNYRLDLSYDGTNYSGWQSQKNADTIQDQLEKSLIINNIPFKNLMASGRTDAGVHANNQVVSLKADTSIPGDRLKYALNQKLPQDIRIIKSSQVNDNFNARYSALGKSYIYYIDLNQNSTAIASRYSWNFPYPIDSNKILEASNFLKGKHDFINFRSTGSSIKSTIREVDVIKPEFLPNNFLKLEYIGNGFLYNMVRILTGTILFYANDKISSDQLYRVFKEKNRNLTGITAPPQGLFLDKVFYNFEEKLEKIKEKS